MIWLLLTVAWGHNTPNFDGWPPARYAGNAAAYVHFTDQKRISARCDEKGDPLPSEACSFGPPNEIYMPNPCSFPPSDDYARLMCHEIGHLNGWPDNHPR
jgi:hypothetical protein